jgi:hypothetical protein
MPKRDSTTPSDACSEEEENKMKTSEKGKEDYENDEEECKEDDHRKDASDSRKKNVSTHSILPKKTNSERMY